jgi:hypothetical protein
MRNSPLFPIASMFNMGLTILTPRDIQSSSEIECRLATSISRRAVRVSSTNFTAALDRVWRKEPGLLIGDSRYGVVCASDAVKTDIAIRNDSPDQSGLKALHSKDSILQLISDCYRLLRKLNNFVVFFLGLNISQENNPKTTRYLFLLNSQNNNFKSEYS